MTARQFNRELDSTAPSLTTSLPYYPSLTKPIMIILFSLHKNGANLREIFTKTNTIPPHYQRYLRNLLQWMPCLIRRTNIQTCTVYTSTFLNLNENSDFVTDRTHHEMVQYNNSHTDCFPTRAHRTCSHTDKKTIPQQNRLCPSL